VTNVAPIALQPHMMAQVAAQQNVSGASPLSTGSTPQSVTPNTSIQAAPPTPPVHHPGSVPNQPPTPTPQQPIMYAGITPHGGSTPATLSAHSANTTAHFAANPVVPLIFQSSQNIAHTAHAQMPGPPGHVHTNLSHSNNAPAPQGVPQGQAHVPVPVIPTSAAIVATPQPSIGAHYAPNSQGRV
jgi:hypothetical protein